MAKVMAKKSVFMNGKLTLTGSFIEESQVAQGFEKHFKGMEEKAESLEKEKAAAKKKAEAVKK